MMVQEWNQRAEYSIQKNTEAIGKVMAKVEELEQEIARGAAGDRCKKSFFSCKSRFAETFRRQGGGLEKLAGGGGGVTWIAKPQASRVCSWSPAARKKTSLGAGQLQRSRISEAWLEVKETSDEVRADLHSDTGHRLGGVQRDGP